MFSTIAFVLASLLPFVVSCFFTISAYSEVQKETSPTQLKSNSTIGFILGSIGSLLFGFALIFSKLVVFDVYTLVLLGTVLIFVSLGLVTYESLESSIKKQNK